MLFAVISMEPHLDELPKAREDLLTVAAAHARDVHLLCNDVAAMIFPSAMTPPTEAKISAVTGKLVALVADIEAQLHGSEGDKPTGLPKTWPLMAQSGFLRDADLIDFILARVAEDRLETIIASSTQSLPAILLDHADPNVADAAQALLAADTLHRRTRGFTHHALRPELLHQLCWRIVAAIEVGNGDRDARVVDRARELLAEYDESRTAEAAARKVVHFLGDDRQADLQDPITAGLQLYVACLANVLEIDQDHILHLIDIGSSAPLSVMLRAAGNNAEQAKKTIYLFKGFELTPHDIAMFETDFEDLHPDAAKLTVREWAYLRSQFLVFSRRTPSRK
jgi:hypothetical protein